MILMRKPTVLFDRDLNKYYIISANLNQGFNIGFIYNYNKERKILGLPAKEFDAVHIQYGAEMYIIKGQKMFLFKSIAKADECMQEYYMPKYIAQKLMYS